MLPESKHRYQKVFCAALSSILEVSVSRSYHLIALSLSLPRYVCVSPFLNLYTRVHTPFYDSRWKKELIKQREQSSINDQSGKIVNL